MGANVNSGLVSAELNGSISVVNSFPEAATSQTLVVATGSTAGGNATNTLYTVTAGKTFYMTSIALDAALSNSSSHATVQLQILDNATAKHIHVQNSTAEGGRQLLFPTPIAFTDTVKLTTTNAAGSDPVRWSLQGWES